MVKIKVQNLEPPKEEIVKEEIEEDETPETTQEIETKPLKQQKMISCRTAIKKCCRKPTNIIIP